MNMKTVVFPFKNPAGNLLLSWLITWVYVMGVLYITIPMITLSEAESPPFWETIFHLTLMAPGLFFFFFVFSSTFSQLQSFRFLIYPLLVITFPIWFILTLLGFGATVIWFMFFVFPIWIIGIPTAFFIGLFLDLKKKQSKPNQ